MGFPKGFGKLRVTARNAALRTLLLMDAGMPVQAALDMALGAAPHAPAGQAGSAAFGTALAARDRHLCAELAYGCLRAEIRIDYVLGRVLPRPGGLPRPLRHILALGVYGLLLQDRTPPHAVLHEAVEQARTLYGPRLAGLTNAALRSVQRLGEAPRHEDFYRQGAADPLGALALFCAAPDWLARLWARAYGEADAALLLRRSCGRPWSGLRVNARRPEGAALLTALRALPGAAAVGDWGVALGPGELPESVMDRPLAHWQAQGALSFQSAGSQRVLAALDLYALEGPVWDMCAGYGGKTAALLERGVAVGLCTDSSFGRLRALPGHCARLGLHLPSVCLPPVCLADAARPPLARWPGSVLLDAPCSGLGVLARRPDIRRRGPERLAALTALQGRLLERAAALLEPGRCLAYITCTLNPDENEGVVAGLLRQHPDLRLEQRWQTPHDHPWLEGMFGALLRRRA